MGKRLNTTNDGQTGGSAYLGAIKALRVCINDGYDEGGWLPSGRKMAKIIGICHPTYCKAVKFLESEGVVRSYPKKGHYVVPSYLRCDKIGIILYNGGESPFLRRDIDISGAVDLFAASDYDCQILQAVTLKQLYDNALIYGIKGALWFCPPPKAIPTIEAFNAAGNLPLVIVQNGPSALGFGPNCVSYDTKSYIEKRVQSLMTRGHRTIAYVGNYDYACQSGIVTLIQAAGGRLTRGCCVEAIDKTPGMITRLIQHEKVTGILSEGGGFTVKCLFEELSELPVERQPDVVVTNSLQLLKLAERFPRVKLMSEETTRINTLGREAAEMLLRYLTSGEALTARKI